MADTTTGTTTGTTSRQEDEQRQLLRTCQDLVREFGDRLSESEVQARFEEILHSFDGAPVRSFVPVLAARATRAQLRAQTSAA